MSIKINSKVEKAVKSKEAYFMFKGGMILESTTPIAKSTLFNTGFYGNFECDEEGDFGDFMIDPNTDFSFCAESDDEDDDDDLRDEIEDGLDRFRDNFNADDIEIRGDKLFIFDESETIGRDAESTALLFQLKKCTSLEEFISFNIEDFEENLDYGSWYTKELRKMSMSESEIIEYLSEIENNK